MNIPKLRIKMGEDSTFRYIFTNEQDEIINSQTFSFVKSFNDEYAFVYENQQWDIIDSDCKSVLKRLKHKNIIQIALDNIIPQDCFFLKNYKIEQNLVVSVDFLRVKKELEKLFPFKWNQGEERAPWRNYFHWNYSQQALFVINISRDELCFSFIEDITLPGNNLIGIKPYDEHWRYISVADFNEHKFENMAFECKIEHAYQFIGGLAKVKTNGLFGFIDLNGSFAIPANYDDARSFNEGLAAVAIANCRKQKGSNNKYFSDLRWNFIDISNRPILPSSHDMLTKKKDGDFYYYNSIYTNEWYNCACFDNKKMKEKILFRKYGEITSTCDIKFYNAHWAIGEALGQLSPAYLVDLLTGQLSEELGFKRWYVLARNESMEAYSIIQYLSCNLPVETLDIDFDTTQTEFDYIIGINSIFIKYGEKYISDKWKAKKERTNYSEVDEFETDWTYYNDNLDMDQQSDDFWNQF
jgi:hypothetical protein